MHVLGELKTAQLEQIAATTTTPAATGRVYSDITNPLAAVPMFYNGTAWRAMALSQTSTFISQNSGKTCTVDWSTGLYQRVVLTDNCIISFSNPQSGAVHTLVVSQAATNSTAANYLYKFNMIDQEVGGKNYQPNQYLPMGKNAVVSWYYSAGIRAAYTTVPQLVSALHTSFLPAGNATCGDFAPAGEMMLIGHPTSPFGSQVPIFQGREKPTINPIVGNTAWAAQVNGVSYSPDGGFVFVSSGTSPYIQGRWSHSGVTNATGESGIGANSFGNPGTLPTGAGQCVAAHPSGAFVVIGHTTTPFMSAYPFDSSGFGTKIANPATLPAAQVNAVDWSPVGDFLAAGSQTSPYIQVWPFTFAGATGSFGSVVANPATLPGAGPAAAVGKSIAWHPAGTFIAMIMSSSPYLYIVAFNRSTGAFGASVTINYTPPAQLLSIRWTPDGQYLVCGTSASPYIVVLDFSASTIGSSAVTLDSTGIGQTINDAVIHPSGEWAACVLAASPNVKTIPLPNKVRNYLRL